MSEKTGPNATIDIEGLRRFIRERKLGGAHDLRAENISLGHSNEVHLVHFEGNSWVLRRPPRGPLLPTAHDVIREYRILNALQNTAVPVPRVFAASEDPQYIGAPFYLMEYVRGEVIRTQGPHFANTPERRRVVSEKMIDTLVAMQQVDWRGAGLEGFGRPDGYLPRQLNRWSDQLARTLPFTRPLPVMEKVREWLATNLPESPPATIVHGDYKLDNLMWEASDPPRAVAVFDWEMSTIGDPLADLGWLLSSWPDPTGANPIPTVTPEPGFLLRGQMLERYESKTGIKMAQFPFYHAFALFKLAIILEGSYSRYVRGQADDPVFERYKDDVPAFGEAAWAICAHAGG